MRLYAQDGACVIHADHQRAAAAVEERGIVLVTAV